MVELLEGCGLYEDSPEPTILARARAIELLGPDVVTKKRGRAQMSDAEIKAVAARKTLRSFAVHIGGAPKGSSYRMKVPELIQAILAVTDDDGASLYAGIAEMSDDAIRDLINNDAEDSAKPEPKSEPKSKPKSKPRKTRKTRLPESPEEGSIPALPPTTRKPASRKPASRKPASRKPASRKPSTGGSADFSLIENMVKDIGVMVETQSKSVAHLTAAISSIEEKIEVIDQHLCWAYNQEVTSGNEIGSLSEISWM
jgi:23S rRNA (uridine2552-2'-O)-methyltransferase